MLIALLAAVTVGATRAEPVAAATTERVLVTRKLDSTKVSAPKWIRVDFTTTRTDTAGFRLSWTGTADLRFEIRTASTGSVVTSNVTAGTTSPKTASAALTAGTGYYAAVWSYSGTATATLTIIENVTTPPVERTIGTGTLDSARVNAPKWVRHNFTGGRTDTATFRLTWTGAADLRFEIRLASTGAIVGRNVTPGTASPKLATIPLTAGTAYYAAVWSYSGRGTYSLTVREGTEPPPPPPPPERPNVIVIELDDMNSVSLPYLPKINQWLVAQGTRFPNAYVSTPSCCPSRSTLMSGRYVHNNGQYNQNNVGLDNSLSLQRYLHDAGYFTGHSGKYLHWWPLGDVAPYWDRWTYFKGGYTDIWIDYDGEGRFSTDYSTKVVFDRAIEYLDDFEARDDGRPFYMQLTPIAPHSPSIPEAAYASAAVPPAEVTPAHQETDLSDKPAFVRGRTESAATTAATRTAMIRTLYTVDDQVDRLMQALESRGELDHTMVIFTSDNGYMWGEHQLGSKFLPYTPAVNVPFVIRWPGQVAAGATDQRFVTHVDIVPTVLAATGTVQQLAPVDGRDILSGHNRQQMLTEYFYDTANGNGIPTWAAVRTATYLYVEYYGQTTATNVTPSVREYYDLVADPYQLTNLYGDGNPANDPNTAALSAQLAALKTCQASSCP